MCYLVREEQARLEAGATAPVPGPDRVRPRRLAGALAMTMAGGLALAALVAPTTTSTTASLSPQRATAAPIASRTETNLPAAGGLERTALPADDGVPSSSVPDVAGAGVGPCHHGM